MGRYKHAILVLIAPPLAMLFVQYFPNAWLLPTSPEMLKPGCYIHQAKKIDVTNCDRLPAADAKASPNPKAKTGAQLRAMEVKARAEFGLATAFLIVVSLGAAAFAAYQLHVSWWNTAGPAEAANRAHLPADKKFIRRILFFAIVLAAAAAYRDWNGHDFGHTLVLAVIEASKQAESVMPSMHKALECLLAINLFAAYLSTALLLVYLASLTIPTGDSGQGTNGLVGLQFGIVFGAVIFALGSFANKTGVAWATLAIEEGPGTPLADLMKTIVDVWAAAASAFMLVAIGTAYYGIRSAPDRNTAAVAGLMADKTASGDDFKALGWLVQIMLALAPIWAPQILGKVFDAAKTIQ
ncbi:MAG: hypothetical protein WCE79_21015 [Xanthobacteraceae bacterium]